MGGGEVVKVLGVVYIAGFTHSPLSLNCLPIMQALMTNDNISQLDNHIFHFVLTQLLESFPVVVDPFLGINILSVIE